MANNKSHKITSKKKFGNITSVCILSIIILVLTLYFVQDIAIFVHTNSGRNCEYSGSYELRKIHRTRNTTYQFTLENGDTVTAIPGKIENNQRIEDFDELKFSYTLFKTAPFFTHTAVSITTTDGEICFLSIDDTLAEARLGIWTFAILIGIIVSVVIAGGVVWWRLLRSSKKRK